MIKWIRWRGLIAFTAVVMVLAVLWLFFVDSIVRSAVERTGTAIAGAEVDVAGARVTLSPLGIALTGIQVTDPEHPSENSVEMGRVAFSLDASGLLLRKVLIRELTADGLRFGTVRKKPGFVAKREKKKPPEKKSFSLPLPTFKMPDVKEILARERFESPKVIDDARAAVRRTREEWQKKISELPDKASIDAYRRRLDKLKASSLSNLQNLAAAAADAKKLADDLNGDLERVRKARTALNADLSSVRALAARAAQAPSGDVRRVMDKYSISPSGLRNMSRALFGGKIVSWFDTGLVWYGRIAPLLSAAVSRKDGSLTVEKPVRGKGVEVKFPEQHPLPDFLIRTVRASLQPEAGSFSGTIKNITRDQNIIGVPLTFRFDGEDMKGLRTISLSGSLDHIHPDRIDDTIHIRAGGYRAADMVLSGGGDLPISLRDGLMDLEVTGRRDAAGIRATFVASFRSVRFQAGGEKDGAIVASLRNALSRITAFSLTADISGTPDNYDVRVTSDLDRVFSNAIGRMVKEQSSRLENGLNAAVREKTGGGLQDLKSGLAGLNDLGGSIDSVQNRLEALLTETKQKTGGKLKLPF